MLKNARNWKHAEPREIHPSRRDYDVRFQKTTLTAAQQKLTQMTSSDAELPVRIVGKMPY